MEKRVPLVYRPIQWRIYDYIMPSIGRIGLIFHLAIYISFEKLEIDNYILRNWLRLVASHTYMYIILMYIRSWNEWRKQYD